MYRTEQWYDLLEEALLLGLDCARQMGEEEDVLRYSLELLSDGNFACSDSLTNLVFCLKVGHDPFRTPAFISSPATAPDAMKPEIIVKGTELVSFGIDPRSHSSL